jgi:stringent starvation protein B
MLVVLSVMFYGQIFLYLNRYKNLKALKLSAEHSQAAKKFYMAYMGVYQAGDQPHIQAVLKDIEFNPPIEPKDEEYMNFNVSPLAVKNLILEPEQLKFSAKFYGQIIELSIPLASIVLISGQSGIGFKQE